MIEADAKKALVAIGFKHIEVDKAGPFNIIRGVIAGRWLTATRLVFDEAVGLLAADGVAALAEGRPIPSDDEDEGEQS